MKFSDGFTRPLPSVLLVVFYLYSLVALTLVLKRIDVSFAHAIRADVGTVLVAIVGVQWFRESVSLLKAASIRLVALGVAGLHLSSIAGEH